MIHETEQSFRRKYGKFRGHHKWDLACAWFKCSNDVFFDIYGFNFVPRGRLYEEARKHVHNIGSLVTVSPISGGSYTRWIK
ncbi:hypothetical protein NRS6094_04333 [Bacillus subtilis]|nr:hypothetical protein NRS6094_04333 [Bacillus subtilis]